MQNGLIDCEPKYLSARLPHCNQSHVSACSVVMQGHPLLFRGELPQVPDLGHILAGFSWCERELLMCKSQPILAGTAHCGTAANYGIVQQG